MSTEAAAPSGTKRKAEEVAEGAKDNKKAFTMQTDLIELADEFKKSAGVISDAEAHGLWEAALDGPGVTQNEFATLDHILATYKFTDKARKYLSGLVTQAKSGKSMYKTINKTRYDRSCLDLAVHLAKDGKLDVADAKLIWEDVEDGPGVTACEKRSVEYVMAQYALTEGAKKHFDDQLAAWKAPVRKPIKPRKRNRAQKKFTLQIDLVQLAEEFKKSAGVISDAEAHKLWQSALDGPGVTHNEFATLDYILSTYKFTDKARKYLEELVVEKASGSSFYKMIKGTRYDRSCLDLADHLLKDGKLDLGDAKQLWEDVSDGGRVTVVEQRTISYLMTQNTLTDGAKAFFEEKIASLTPPPSPSAEEKQPDVAVVAPPTNDLIDATVELVWQAYDTDNSGDLDKIETKKLVQDGLCALGTVNEYSEEAFEQMFNQFDKDNNGTLDKTEMRGFLKSFM